jgi:oligoribonuclease NrnB/cAMP/cGMP phosphodiesterase (DHH superfamily)
MKITVIHHSADFDGLFCREIARKFLPNSDFFGWDYGQPLIPFPDEGPVYILDLSPDCLAECSIDVVDRIIWIDHHKSAIEKWAKTIPGYRIDGVAACRLAWQWFSYADQGMLNGDFAMPDKQHFIDRQVQEPLAVRLAGEYDIWDKREPAAETLQYGLRAQELHPDHWKVLLQCDQFGDNLTGEFVATGRAIQLYQKQADAVAMKNSFIIEFEGLKFLALNTQAKSSLAFMSKDVPETGHDALLKFSFNGSIWDCSMYHAKHNTGIDLSTIAVKYGGGGHRGACGFRCSEPFFLKR